MGRLGDDFGDKFDHVVNDPNPMLDHGPHRLVIELANNLQQLAIGSAPSQKSAKDRRQLLNDETRRALIANMNVTLGVRRGTVQC